MLTGSPTNHPTGSALPTLLPTITPTFPPTSSSFPTITPTISPSVSPSPQASREDTIDVFGSNLSSAAISILGALFCGCCCMCIIMACTGLRYLKLEKSRMKREHLFELTALQLKFKVDASHEDTNFADEGKVNWSEGIPVCTPSDI